MRDLCGSTSDQLQKIFADWNKGELNSYLIEITAQIFGFKDTDGKLLLDKILDVAGQKGTGKWTGISALDLGLPVTLIAKSVFARCLSALKEERVEASRLYPKQKAALQKESFIAQVRDALYASKIVSYAQGFMLMREAALQMKWNLNFGKIALIWRGGCIIRSRFLGDIQKAFSLNAKLPNLLLDPFFHQEISRCLPGWRAVGSLALQAAIAVPTLAAGLTFLDGYTTAQLPANLLQAQRDFFGAHTYERVDQPRGKFFHTEWMGNG